jgi:cyanophycinase-like exopeptidase
VAVGTVTLIGSGELSPTLGKVHRDIMSRLAVPVRAVFLDTPAGFQLNVDQLAERAKEYFRRSLDTELEIASFRASNAPVAQREAALQRLEWGNYIFAGPGSPTYAIRSWRGTPVMGALSRRLLAGAHLVFASAATIAMSRYALPVYEIYKVGEEVRWVEGLNLLGPFGLELAIVPHWNNAEGGNHDTRFCFMGAPRLARLEAELPKTATILGIDEFTACTIDLAAGRVAVMGKGQVTLRRDGREICYPAGSIIELARLGETSASWSPADLVPGESVDDQPTATPEANQACWVDPSELVDLLVWLRAQLRQAKQWPLADAVRDRLAELGVVVEDGRDGSTWRSGE